VNKEELKKWLLNKFNGCYKAKYLNNENIFYFYDEQFVRQKKLSRIVGDEIIYPSSVKGKCLFEQDTDELLLFCDYTEIWSVIKTNYILTPKYLESDYNDIRSFIKEILLENTTIKNIFSNYTIECDVINENFNNQVKFSVLLNQK